MRDTRIARLIGAEIAEGRGRIERRPRLRADDWQGEVEGRTFRVRWPDGAGAYEVELEEVGHV